ncbi:DUF5133 domain-containing protein [Kitasatospora sp. NPDC052896]|uniref:DUF5133 domain-containing protein n=1 Tax=Kitasatospora sp. NPDC052896 TaxID=3364061 RepID=UPI0037C7CECA
MPLIDYAVLRKLVAELDALDACPHTEAHARRRGDAQYTVCIYTGERDPERALATARRLLATRAATERVSGSVKPSERGIGYSAVLGRRLLAESLPV